MPTAAGPPPVPERTWTALLAMVSWFGSHPGHLHHSCFVPQVLTNETHWRIYENARRVGQILTSALQQSKFSMQDFLGHVGNHCHFVSITCRNEVSSFRIFSTINSRGQELSVVDKIKAEMFQQLPDGRRAELADR